MSTARDLAALIEPVARILLGEPNLTLSSKHELRYGSRGSLAIDLKKGVWRDHERGVGGGVLDLIHDLTGLDGAERFAWIEQHGLEIEQARSTPRRANGSQRAPRGVIDKVHPYRDEGGAVLFEVVRFDPKDFRQRRPDPNKPGDFIWSTKGVRQVPYRLPDLIERLDRVVFIVEGEKDADRLWSLGVPATTNAGGANKWNAGLNEFFRNADVVIIPDHDPQKCDPKTGAPMFHDDGRPVRPGQDHAQDVARHLVNVVNRVRVLELWKHWPEMPPKGDVSDWLDQGGGSVERLYLLADGTAEWAPENVYNNSGDVHNFEPEPARQPPPLILSSAQFVADFVPPDYVVEGILQRRFIYSLTGKSGAGKTATFLLLAAHVGLGRPLGDRTVEQGRVLYLAGENPDDARMRWIAMAQQMDFDINTIPVHFIPGTFKLSQMFDRIRREIEQIGKIALLLIDTGPAFFEGDNENDNKQAGDHARRMRGYIAVPGGPCVVVASHPAKNATDDNLTPRGGGAYVAEIDGNLTARADAGSVEVHTQGKFRGPDFAPITFQLRTVTHERLKDSKGRLIPTVVASYLSEAGRAEIAKTARTREDELLAALIDHGDASQAELARLVGWNMRDGSPYKVLVARTLDTLKRAKLITATRDGFTLTAEGKKAADKARAARPAPPVDLPADLFG